MRKEIDKFKNWEKKTLTEQNNMGIIHVNQELKVDSIVPGGAKFEPYSVAPINEDVKYISTFIKGTRTKKTEDFRLQVLGLKSGEKYFMFFKDDFGGPYIEFISLSHINEINPNHFKFKSYNYYHLRENVNDVNLVLQKWVDMNGKMSRHSSFRIKSFENYTYLFEFNGMKY